MTLAPDIRQVLVHPVVWPHLELWLASRGLVLARVPVEDDLPTYAMTPAEPGDAEKVLAAGIRDAARQASGQQPDTGAAERTPCSGLAPCEDGGELCDQHEREQAHAEGEHAFCGDECICTCDSAGPEFVPAGHYRDCPQYAPAPAAGLSDTQPAVDRAAVLREAADIAERENAGCPTTAMARPCPPCVARTAAATTLRRMADEETSR
ncbi:hypothetical protein [Streptomyces sp. NPDC013489]|uniref:hypothetical protein n=1 Tax=Streptomyces sp. NPDC013489 TaxID=3155606 RepID=UPI0033F1C9ED